MSNLGRSLVVLGALGGIAVFGVKKYGGKAQLPANNAQQLPADNAQQLPANNAQQLPANNAPQNQQPTYDWDNNWDARYDLSIRGPRVVTERHIYLLRPCSVSTVRNGGTELSAEGGVEAERACELLSQVGALQKIRSSDETSALKTYNYMNTTRRWDRYFRVRDKATTDIFNEVYPCTPDPALLGPPMAPHRIFVDEAKAEAAFRMMLHRHDGSAVTIRPVREVYIVDKILIRYLLLRTLQMKPSFWSRWDVEPGSITEFVCRVDGTVKVRSVGQRRRTNITLL